MKYRTKENETLDLICHNHYNQTNGTVEKVLAVNPDLADYPAKLPAGLIIHLPNQITTTPIKPSIKLWD